MKPKKRAPSREELDDEKFRTAVEGAKFRKRIEREANEAMVCLRCGSCDWRMQPKCVVNWVGNEVFATMVCRRCKRKMPFPSWIDPYPEDEPGEVDEFELEDLTDMAYRELRLTGVNLFVREAIKDRIRQRLLKYLT